MKEQYQKELSQIHVPVELLEKTKQAMKEEQEKIESEEKKKAKVLSFPKVSVAAAAAGVLLLVVPAASGMLNDSGEPDSKNMQMHLGGQAKPEIQEIGKDKNFIEEIIDAIKDFFE